MSSFWLLQQAFRPSMLNQSQQEVHRAAQALAWMGQSVVQAASDDSHTNLGYWVDNRAFVSHALNDQGYLALHLPSFALVLLDNQKEEIERFPLGNLTKSQVLDVLRQIAQRFGFHPESIQMNSHNELEPQWEAADVLAMPPADHLEELHRYRANIIQLLEELKIDWVAPDETRTWPHHFDTASLDVIKMNEKGENQQTIGVGMAIADNLVAEPYYYVSYWDRDETKTMETLPLLEEGQWKMNGFHGAVLPISVVNNATTEARQAQILRNFILESRQACLNHLQS